MVDILRYTYRDVVMWQRLFYTLITSCQIPDLLRLCSLDVGQINVAVPINVLFFPTAFHQTRQTIDERCIQKRGAVTRLLRNDYYSFPS